MARKWIISLYKRTRSSPIALLCVQHLHAALILIHGCSSSSSQSQCDSQKNSYLWVSTCLAIIEVERSNSSDKCMDQWISSQYTHSKHPANTRAGAITKQKQIVYLWESDIWLWTLYRDCYALLDNFSWYTEQPVKAKAHKILRLRSVEKWQENYRGRVPKKIWFIWVTKCSMSQTAPPELTVLHDKIMSIKLKCNQIQV